MKAGICSEITPIFGLFFFRPISLTPLLDSYDIICLIRHLFSLIPQLQYNLRQQPAFRKLGKKQILIYNKVNELVFFYHSAALDSHVNMLY